MLKIPKDLDTNNIIIVKILNMKSFIFEMDNQQETNNSKIISLKIEFN